MLKFPLLSKIRSLKASSPTVSLFYISNLRSITNTLLKKIKVCLYEFSVENSRGLIVCVWIQEMWNRWFSPAYGIPWVILFLPHTKGRISPCVFARCCVLRSFIQFCMWEIRSVFCFFSFFCFFVFTSLPSVNHSEVYDLLHLFDSYFLFIQLSLYCLEIGIFIFIYLFAKRMLA